MASTMHWLEPLGNAVVDEILNSKISPPGLAGALLCCLIRHYTSLCGYSKQTQSSETTPPGNADVLAGDQHSLLASMMLLVHFIPRIVSGNSGANLFHSPLNILICTRDMLRQVCPSGTLAGADHFDAEEVQRRVMRTKDEEEDSTAVPGSEAARLRASFQRTSSRIEHQMMTGMVSDPGTFSDAAVSSQFEWNEIA